MVLLCYRNPFEFIIHMWETTLLWQQLLPTQTVLWFLLLPSPSKVKGKHEKESCRAAGKTSTFLKDPWRISIGEQRTSLQGFKLKHCVEMLSGTVRNAKSRIYQDPAVFSSDTEDAVLALHMTEQQEGSWSWKAWTHRFVQLFTRQARINLPHKGSCWNRCV